MTTPQQGDEYAEIDEIADLEAPADAQQQVGGGVHLHPATYNSNACK